MRKLRFPSKQGYCYWRVQRAPHHPVTLQLRQVTARCIHHAASKHQVKTTNKIVNTKRTRHRENEKEDNLNPPPPTRRVYCCQKTLGTMVGSPAERGHAEHAGTSAPLTPPASGSYKQASKWATEKQPHAQPRKTVGFPRRSAKRGFPSHQTHWQNHPSDSNRADSKNNVPRFPSFHMSDASKPTKQRNHHPPNSPNHKKSSRNAPMDLTQPHDMTPQPTTRPKRRETWLRNDPGGVRNPKCSVRPKNP